ncbi:hypothetical protein AMTRI_Chr02g263790 [Amborella trichopoda]
MTTFPNFLRFRFLSITGPKKVMFPSSRVIGFSLIIILSWLFFGDFGVLGVRFLHGSERGVEMADLHIWRRPQIWKKPTKLTTPDFYVSKREVPSCPDPLHNR